MSLYKDWIALTEIEGEQEFKDFWKEYSEGETAIYKAILASKNTHVEGLLGDLAKEAGVRPVIYMGFLDGIQTSLAESFPLEKLTQKSAISMDIDWHKLFFNMINADADYLYGLPEWDEIFTEDERKAIADEWRRSRTVRREKEPGRNDPCPCGSGLKYKKCCGKNK